MNGQLLRTRSESCGTDCDQLIVEPCASAARRNAPTQHVGHGSHEAFEAWLAERAIADDETIDRIEQQLVQRAGAPRP